MTQEQIKYDEITFAVDVWISTGYTFYVQASTAMEARDKVQHGDVSIDYTRLQAECTWDFGHVDVSDVYEVKV